MSSGSRLREQCDVVAPGRRRGHPDAGRGPPPHGARAAGQELQADRSRSPRRSSDTVLVVGGGVGRARGGQGRGRARPPGRAGRERATSLGGHLAGCAKSLLPEEPPYDRPARQPAADARRRASVARPDVTVLHLDHDRAASPASPGSSRSSCDGPSGATSSRSAPSSRPPGARPYDAAKLGHLGYGASPDVVTSHELEAMLGERQASRARRRPAARSGSLFVQCAGSRDAEHLPYCSSECCATTLRQVAAIHRGRPRGRDRGRLPRHAHPGPDRALLPRRSRSSRAACSPAARSSAVEGNGTLAVHLSRQPARRRASTLEADLVVLAVGMVPNAADGEAIRTLHDAQRAPSTARARSQRAEARKLVERARRPRGHRDPQPRLPPGARTCRRSGTASPTPTSSASPTRRAAPASTPPARVHAPMDAAQAAEDGWGAAMKAVQCIDAAERGEAVHPRAGDRRRTPTSSCSAAPSASAAPRSARSAPSTRTRRARRSSTRCAAAAAASAWAPARSGSSRFPDYSVRCGRGDDQGDRGPRGVRREAAHPRPDVRERRAAGARRRGARSGSQWNPWVRVIPIRCLGSTNIVWIAEALSRGIDGVILIGCKYGDDYQCHYVRGSELANTRLGNVQETLHAPRPGARAHQGRRAGPRRVRPHPARSSTSSPPSSRTSDPTR